MTFWDLLDRHWPTVVVFLSLGSLVGYVMIDHYLAMWFNTKRK